MDVTSIFLDPKSLDETGGYYGVVAGHMSSVNAQQRFTDQYLFKPMLVEELQNRLNAEAQAMAELPSDANRVAVTERWLLLNELLKEIKAL